LDRRRRDRPHRASCFVGGGTVVRRPGRLRPIWEEPELWLLRLDRDRRWRRRAALVLLSPANVLALHGRHAQAVPLWLAPERLCRPQPFGEPAAEPSSLPSRHSLLAACATEQDGAEAAGLRLPAQDPQILLAHAERGRQPTQVHPRLLRQRHQKNVARAAIAAVPLELALGGHPKPASDGHLKTGQS